MIECLLLRMLTAANLNRLGFDDSFGAVLLNCTKWSDKIWYFDIEILDIELWYEEIYTKLY